MEILSEESPPLSFWYVDGDHTRLTWREYHEASIHTPESLRRDPHILDWNNMPDPFRHYKGVPLLDLPADPPAPEIPALEVLQGKTGSKVDSDGAGFLSRLLFYSAAISASKRVPSTGDKYALRVNPSSGNLHPTEFHFLTTSLEGWPAGLYHYRPSSHMAEQRALGNYQAALAGLTAPVVFVLTSITWREVWKYRTRAYRYCLHDIGHAWQALALAARATGCESRAVAHFADDEVARVCGLNEDEWPMLLLAVDGTPLSRHEPDAVERVWFGGRANPLSHQSITCGMIEAVHGATRLNGEFPPVSSTEPPQAGTGEIALPAPLSSSRSFGVVARNRRSALDFQGGDLFMSIAQLSTILDAAAQPLAADFARERLVQLYLYVHRVDGFEPGVYRHWPERSQLQRLRSGDQRVVASGLSLRQDLAGNACLAFSMTADFERAARAYGDRGYRYAHFEAGAIGQRLYLAAEAVGLRATGIGAFFDNAVNRYLELTPEQGRVLYHFAIGYPVPDGRLDA